MALQQSEKRLMAILGIALFAVVNFVGYSTLEGKKNDLNEEKAELNEQLTWFTGLEKTKPKWEDRRTFLIDQCPQPAFVSEEAAAVEIEAHLKACALVAGVSETSLVIKPTEMIATANYNQVALNVNASGSAMSIMKLVSLIQAANHSNENNGTIKHGYYAIPNIQFEADRKDPTMLKCALILARWYSTEVNSSTTVSVPSSTKSGILESNLNNAKLTAAK
ncbi:MAG: hypothetical protein CMO54_10895 [Verrucomicrobiales bacterium]|nr:hypothetical protein [Verrucomicrobiales bacterium]